MRGKHSIADIRNIFNLNLIKTVDGVKPLMKKKNEMKLNVEGEISHQFQSFGATLLYLLAENHLSIHMLKKNMLLSIYIVVMNLLI